MKKPLKYLTSIVVIVLFLCLNWATSESVIEKKLNADVRIYQDSLIVFENKDSIEINNAMLMISEPSGEYYFFNKYNLPSSSADTLFIRKFKDVNGISYQQDSLPTFFSLTFGVPNENVAVIFNKEL